MANTYLTRTPSSSGSNTTWTFSCWFKKASIGLDTVPFATGYTSPQIDEAMINIGADDQLRFNIAINDTTDVTVKSSRKLRDTSGWYHIVVACDTTQATASDRIKIYFNGELETNLSVTDYPTQNQSTFFGDTNKTQEIGRQPRSSNYLNGSMSHVHFIDGIAYTPSAFGETDATTGEWKAKTSPSVTYGTNGFFILKDGNSVTDQSGNSNNFTVAGGTLTDLKDNPDNTFATLNPLVKKDDYTLSQGNNTIAYGSATSRACCLSTLGMSSGKFYAELKVTASSTSPCQAAVGIANNSDNTNSGYYPSQGNNDNAASYQFWDGTKNVGSSGAAYGGTVAVNDIMGFAFDIDNKAMYVSKNGVWQNSGIPTSGASKTNAIDFSSITDNGFWFLIIGDGSGVQTFTSSFNFGNGYFGTTAVASAGTNASGNGIFEYDVPTGYTALSTKGLNL